MRGDGAERRLALARGAFGAATGAWPIVHLPSFEAVTGPKLEGWLVRIDVWYAGVRRRIAPVYLADAAVELALAGAWAALAARGRRGGSREGGAS